MRCYRLSLAFIMVVSAGLLANRAGAEEIDIKPDHPERYVVVKGDTLWGISTRFLKSPWLWPKIWRINEAIKNPHLIYPGDVIVLQWVDGQPQLTVTRAGTVAPETSTLVTPAGSAEAARPVPDRVVKLSPKINVEDLARAIPTISPEIIVPFLTQPLAIEKGALKNGGYITVGLDDRIALGDHSEFYARGIKDDKDEFFHIFRQGPALRNPETGELLAYEAIYLGDARRLETGNPSKLVVTSVKQEIVPTDRLQATSHRQSLPYYFPRSPGKKVEGYIVSAVNAVAEVGTHTVVAISLGRREGVEEGHVLRVMRSAGKHKDPVTRSRYQLPDEESALILVFRTFDKLSYALVMNSTRPVHIHDKVITP